MPWLKLDDGFPEHPKVVAAGAEASWFYVCALAYCNRQLTNGVISRAVLPRISGVSQPLRLANKLVSCGLWEHFDDGFRVHDYLDWNDSADDVRAKRSAISDVRRAAGVAGGRRSGESRREAKAKQLASSLPKQNGSPTPTPTPTPTEDPPLSPASGGSKNGKVTHGDIAAVVIGAINAGRARLQLGGPISPSKTNVAEIIKRLRDGATIEDCLHVVAVGAADVEHGGDAQWFNPATLFRAKTFPMRLAQAAPAATVLQFDPAAIAAQEEKDVLTAQRKLAEWGGNGA